MKLKVGYLTYKAKLISIVKSKNIISAFWSALEALVYPFLMLLVTPYFINRLGAELYGIWMLVNTVIASIGILNVGFGDATIKFVAQYRTKNDQSGVHKIIEATYSVYLVLCFIVILTSFIISFLVKNGAIFNLDHQNRILVSKVFPIAGATLGFKFIEQIFLSTFKGYDRYDIASQISIVGKLVTIAANVAMVYLGYSLQTIFISSLIICLFFLFIEGYLIFFFFNFKQFTPFFDKPFIKEVFSFGIWTWILSVLGLISTQIDKYMVIALTNIKTFAYYSIALTIFSQVHNLYSASVSWIFPLVTNKTTNNEDIAPYYRKSQWMFLSLVCISLTAFFLIKDFFLMLWLGEETFGSTKHFIDLLLCLNFVMAGSIIPYYFLNGTGHFKLNTYFNLANLLARLIFIPTMYYYFSVDGLILGLIFSTLLVMIFQMNTFSSRVLNQPDYFSGLKFIIPSFLFCLIPWIKNTYAPPVIALAILIYFAFLFKPQPKLN